MQKRLKQKYPKAFELRLTPPSPGGKISKKRLFFLGWLPLVTVCQFEQNCTLSSPGPWGPCQVSSSCPWWQAGSWVSSTSTTSTPGWRRPTSTPGPALGRMLKLRNATEALEDWQLRWKGWRSRMRWALRRVGWVSSISGERRLGLAQWRRLFPGHALVH